MNDTKNILIAWISSASTLAAALEAASLTTVISAIVLPILFFAIGKTIDVALQIYFKKRERDREKPL